MQRLNLPQILVGAIALTGIFYLGINYQGSHRNGASLSSVAGLVDEDLTLRQPMLPAATDDAKAVNARPAPGLLRDTAPVSEREPAKALQVELPNAQIPRADLQETGASSRTQPRIVEPDFSRFHPPPKPSGTMVPLANQPVSIMNHDEPAAVPTPVAQQQVSATSQGAFRPMLPPDGAEQGSWVTPELTTLNLRTREQPASHPIKSLAAPQQEANPLCSVSKLTAITSDRPGGTPSQAATFRVHIVRPGETLQSIALRYYHREDVYLQIYAANQDVLDSPINLPAGVTLKIPD